MSKVSENAVDSLLASVQELKNVCLPLLHFLHPPSALTNAYSSPPSSLIRNLRNPEKPVQDKKSVSSKHSPLEQTTPKV